MPTPRRGDVHLRPDQPTRRSPHPARGRGRRLSHGAQPRGPRRGTRRRRCPPDRSWWAARCRRRRPQSRPLRCAAARLRRPPHRPHDGRPGGDLEIGGGTGVAEPVARRRGAHGALESRRVPAAEGPTAIAQKVVCTTSVRAGMSACTSTRRRRHRRARAGRRVAPGTPAARPRSCRTRRCARGARAHPGGEARGGRSPRPRSRREHRRAGVSSPRRDRRAGPRAGRHPASC